MYMHAFICSCRHFTTRTCKFDLLTQCNDLGAFCHSSLLRKACITLPLATISFCLCPSVALSYPPCPKCHPIPPLTWAGNISLCSLPTTCQLFEFTAYFTVFRICNHIPCCRYQPISQHSGLVGPQTLLCMQIMHVHCQRERGQEENEQD